MTTPFEFDDASAQRKVIRDAVATHLDCNHLRFAVGCPQVGFSKIWFARAHGSDFYVAMRSASGSLKVSLHGPNEWNQNFVGRIGYPAEFMRKRRDLNLTPTNRAMTWQRPPPPDEGAHCPLLLTFPTAHLQQGQLQISSRKPWMLLPPAPKHQALEVAFFHSREPVDSLMEKLAAGGVVLAVSALADGSRMSMAVRWSDFDSRTLPTEEMMRRSTVAWVGESARPAPGTAMSDQVGVFWTSGDAGCARVVEVSRMALTLGL